MPIYVNINIYRGPIYVHVFIYVYIYIYIYIYIIICINISIYIYITYILYSIVCVFLFGALGILEMHIGSHI